MMLAKIARVFGWVVAAILLVGAGVLFLDVGWPSYSAGLTTLGAFFALPPVAGWIIRWIGVRGALWSAAAVFAILVPSVAVIRAVELEATAAKRGGFATTQQFRRAQALGMATVQHLAGHDEEVRYQELTKHVSNMLDGSCRADDLVDGAEKKAPVTRVTLNDLRLYSTAGAVWTALRTKRSRPKLDRITEKCASGADCTTMVTALMDDLKITVRFEEGIFAGCSHASSIVAVRDGALPQQDAEHAEMIAKSLGPPAKTDAGLIWGSVDQQGPFYLIRTDNTAHELADPTLGAAVQRRKADIATAEEGRRKEDERKQLMEAEAIVCLDEEFDLGFVRELRVPRNTVFGNRGPITGDIASSWRVIDGSKSRNAAIVTLDEIGLSKSKRCATARVRMLVDGRANEETSAKAADNEVWSINDRLDYLPGRKPTIELGKLVDDKAIVAQLRTDAVKTTTVSRPLLDKQAEAAKCLSEATSVAAQIGGALGRQTSSVVIIGHPAAEQISIGCDSEKPNLFVAWDKRAKPPTATMQLIAKSASIFIGIREEEGKELVSACVSDALKPENHEISDSEYDGVQASCQAFARDGGGGSVTIIRRFGPYPTLAMPSEAALRDLELATAKLRVAERKQSQNDLAFAKWWLDPSVPSIIKSTLMIVTRMQALSVRCPSWKPPSGKIAAMSEAAGIRPNDILPGGQYWETYAMLAIAMRERARDESVKSACEAAQKYER